MYIYDTIIQCAFIVLCIAVYSCLTRGSQDTLHNHLNPDQDKVITEDNWMDECSFLLSLPWEMSSKAIFAPISPFAESELEQKLVFFSFALWFCLISQNT